MAKMYSSNWCGRFLCCFFITLSVFSIWVVLSVDYYALLGWSVNPSPSKPIMLTTDKLPFLSGDKKVIYIATEDSLPLAHNFILRNPGIPIEKIVFRKPGVNSSVHVYPIQRDGLLVRNRKFGTSDIPAIGMLFLFAVVMVGGFYNILCGCRFMGNRWVTDFDDYVVETPDSSPFSSPSGKRSLLPLSLGRGEDDEKWLRKDKVCTKEEDVEKLLSLLADKDEGNSHSQENASEIPESLKDNDFLSILV